MKIVNQMENYTKSEILNNIQGKMHQKEFNNLILNGENKKDNSTELKQEHLILNNVRMNIKQNYTPCANWQVAKQTGLNLNLKV